MARIRTIKPEFWADEKIGTLSFLERLLFIGLWNYADDEGIFKANALYLKGMIFPYDQVDTKTIESALEKFESLKMVFLYEVNGQKYGWIIRFRNYQRIDKPQPSSNPHPSIQNPDYARSIHERDKYTCHLCGQITSPYQGPNAKTFPTIDHLIPQSKGGGHYPTNLKTACSKCNKSRGNKGLAKKHHSKNVPGVIIEHSATEGSVVKGKKENKELNTIPRASEKTTPEIETPKTSTGAPNQEHVWMDTKIHFPKRSGKFLGEQEAFRRFCYLPQSDWPKFLQAVKNYGNSQAVKNSKDGQGIYKPENFIGLAHTEQPWKDWIEPEKKQEVDTDARFDFLKRDKKTGGDVKGEPDIRGDP